MKCNHFSVQIINGRLIKVLLYQFSGKDGATGPQGMKGVDGMPGAAGPAGAIGPSGPPGFPGLAGPKGDRGASGSKGAQGLQGKEVGNFGTILQKILQKKRKAANFENLLLVVHRLSPILKHFCPSLPMSPCSQWTWKIIIFFA